MATYLADLIAAVDPEPVSSTVLSEAAATARSILRGIDPDGYTWGDAGWSAVDHITGLASLIPLVGDAPKGFWAGYKLSDNAIKYGKMFLRAANTYATGHGGINLYKSLEDKYNKYGFIDMWKHTNSEDLRFASEVAMGLLGHTQMNRNNLAAKKTLNESGVETSGTLWGFRTPKIKNTTSTVRLKAGEKSIEVPITEELKSELNNSFKKAGNSAEARLKALNENSKFKE